MARRSGSASPSAREREGWRRHEHHRKHDPRVYPLRRGGLRDLLLGMGDNDRDRLRGAHGHRDLRPMEGQGIMAWYWWTILGAVIYFIALFVVLRALRERWREDELRHKAYLEELLSKVDRADS